MTFQKLNAIYIKVAHLIMDLKKHKYCRYTRGVLFVQTIPRQLHLVFSLKQLIYIYLTLCCSDSSIVHCWDLDSVVGFVAYNFIVFIFLTGIVVSVYRERALHYSCNYRGGSKNDSFTEQL